MMSEWHDMRAFMLSADTNSITAKVDQGVLDVTIGKKKAAVKSRQIDIMGGGDSTGALV